MPKAQSWLEGRIIVAAAAVFATTAPASAATFCANTATGIQAALTAAQDNGEDDVIHIVAGDYVLASALTFVSTEAKNLSIYGNYAGADCAAPAAAPAASTLDGNLLVRPLSISIPNGALTINWVNFVGGRPPSGGSGGGLLIAAANTARIEYSQFFGNRTTGAGGLGGALYAGVTSSGGFVDNLVYGNRGTQIGGVVWQNSGDVMTFARNTITGNISDTASDAGGVQISGGAFVEFANNIVWSNAASGGSDVNVFSANACGSNDIGVAAAGCTLDPGSENVSVDPQFAPCTGFLCVNFELADTSPLIDVGNENVGGSSPIDIAGKPRVQGRNIDIGAYENAGVIFRNGFEALSP